MTYTAATRTVTLTPTSPLANLTVYTATVKSGASGVKDAAGNPLASDVVWTFTTVAGHDGADGEQRDAAECGDERRAGDDGDGDVQRSDDRGEHQRDDGAADGPGDDAGRRRR